MTIKPRNPIARELLTSGKYKQRIVNPKKINKRKFRNEKDMLNYHDPY